MRQAYDYWQDQPGSPRKDTSEPKRTHTRSADKPRACNHHQGGEKPTQRPHTHQQWRPHARRTHRQCSHADARNKAKRPRMLPKDRKMQPTPRRRRTLCHDCGRAETHIGAARHRAKAQASTRGVFQCSVNNRASHRHERVAPTDERPQRTTRQRRGPNARGGAADTESAVDGARAPHSNPPKGGEEETLRARRTASVLTRRCPLGNHPILSLGRCPSSRLLGR